MSTPNDARSMSARNELERESGRRGTPGPTIDEQIKEVRREIGMRERVYPRWVELKKLTQADADRHLAAMRAALETLREVERSRKLI